MTVFTSGNLDVRRALARRQYGHQVLEKIVIVLSEIAVCADDQMSVHIHTEKQDGRHLDGIFDGHDFTLIGRRVG